MKKGQFALEFVILFSFTLLFSAVFLVVIQKSYVESQRMQQEEQINEIMRIISSEVNLAELSPPGYMRNFTIPALIDGNEYSINSSDDVDIVFNYDNMQYVFFFPGINNSKAYSTLKGACSCLKPGLNIITKECRTNECMIELVNKETMTPCIYYNGAKCI